MNDLSKQFFAQLLQRLSKKTPKFFNILTIILGVLASLATAEEAYEKAATSVPEWLPIVGDILKGAVALSAIITAQSAIQTKSTPPLGDDQLPKKS